MVGNETGVKYNPKGNEEVRTTAYKMALNVNRDNMINGDELPIDFSKEKRRLKREKGKEKEISHARSLGQTYEIHQLINNMGNVEEGTKGMVQDKQANFADEFEQSVFNNTSGISFNSNTIVITDNRRKAFEPIYDEKGRMTEMKFHERKATDIPQSNILKKIKTVERLSKELIDKSAEKGIYTSDFCTALNALHEICSSKVYNAENVKMAAEYARIELEKLGILPVHGTQAYIVNIRNNLRELSEI